MPDAIIATLPRGAQSGNASGSRMTLSADESEHEMEAIIGG